MVTSVVVRANPRRKESDAIAVESDATHHTSVMQVQSPISSGNSAAAPRSAPQVRDLPFFPFPLLFMTSQLPHLQTPRTRHHHPRVFRSRLLCWLNAVISLHYSHHSVRIATQEVCPQLFMVEHVFCLSSASHGVARHHGVTPPSSKDIINKEFSSAIKLALKESTEKRKCDAEEYQSELASRVFSMVWVQWAHARRILREEERRRKAQKNALLATGGLHKLVIADDGRRVNCWGLNNHGQAPCEGLDATTGKWTAIAAGLRHSLLLHDDGNILCIGDTEDGRIPAHPHTAAGDFVGVSAGNVHSVALRNNGSVVCWGSNTYGQAPPEGVAGDFVMIAAGGYHTIALRRDGSLACWGQNHYGQAPPEGIQGNFVAIAAGGEHTLAIRTDGRVACWGLNLCGQAPPDGLDGNFVAVAAGHRHSLALRADGSLACFGYNAFGQAPPEGMQGPFTSIAAGGDYSLAQLQQGDDGTSELHGFGKEKCYHAYMLSAVDGPLADPFPHAHP